VSQFDCGGVEDSVFEASSSAFINCLYAAQKQRSENTIRTIPVQALLALSCAVRPGDGDLTHSPEQSNSRPIMIGGTIDRHITRGLILPDRVTLTDDLRVVITATAIVAMAPMTAAIIVAMALPLAARAKDYMLSGKQPQGSKDAKRP
jgi:hypothetical protein